MRMSTGRFVCDKSGADFEENPYNSAQNKPSREESRGSVFIASHDMRKDEKIKWTGICELTFASRYLLVHSHSFQSLPIVRRPRVKQWHAMNSSQIVSTIYWLMICLHIHCRQLMTRLDHLWVITCQELHVVCQAVQYSEILTKHVPIVKENRPSRLPFVR